MRAPKFEWKSSGNRSDSQTLYAGRIRLCSVFWSRISAADTKPYVALSYLQGIKAKEGTDRFETMDEAKVRAEQIATTWFNWLGD